MRSLVLVLCSLLASCASPPVREAVEGRAPEQALLEVEDAWMAALVRRDAEAVGRHLDATFVVNGPAPRLETREQYLATVRMPERTLEPITLTAREVRVLGSTALSFGTGWLRGHWKERALDLRFRYTHVYVLRDGRWLAVAAHVTPVSP